MGGPNAPPDAPAPDAPPDAEELHPPDEIDDDFWSKICSRVDVDVAPTTPDDDVDTAPTTPDVDDVDALAEASALMLEVLSFFSRVR